MQLQTAKDICKIQKEIQENNTPEYQANKIIENIIDTIKKYHNTKSYFVEKPNFNNEVQNILKERGFKITPTYMFYSSEHIALTGFEITWNYD